MPVCLICVQKSLLAVRTLSTSLLTPGVIAKTSDTRNCRFDKSVMRRSRLCSLCIKLQIHTMSQKGVSNMGAYLSLAHNNTQQFRYNWNLT